MKENYWTKEKCQEIALKYKSDFRKGDNYPYVKAYK